jgi:hypothetical protein
MLSVPRFAKESNLPKKRVHAPQGNHYLSHSSIENVAGTLMDGIGGGRVYARGTHDTKEYIWEEYV